MFVEIMLSEKDSNIEAAPKPAESKHSQQAGKQTPPEQSLIKTLTINGIKKVYEDNQTKPIDHERHQIVVQILNVKHFDEKDNKKSVRVRIQISDGSSYLIAMVNNAIFKQEVSGF
jgi:hypothetical protein